MSAGGGAGGGGAGGGTGGGSGGGTGGGSGGGTGGGSGGGTGGGAAGGTGGGSTSFDAGPDQIDLITMAQTVGVNVCSGDVTFNLIHPDGGLAPVGSQTNFTLAANPATGFAFYSGSACNTATTTVTLMAGDTSGTFRFKANPGSWNIAVTRVGYVPGVQTEISGFPTPDGLALASVGGTLPYTVRAGDCSSGLQAYLTHGGVEVNANAATNVTLTTSPAGNGFALGSLKAYSDASCTSQITSPIVIPINGSRTPPFFLKALTGQTYTLTASGGGFTVGTPHTVRPVVRWSSCGFDAGQTGVDCTLSPAQTALANSFSISSTASAETAGAASTVCSLSVANKVACARGVGGGPVSISVQTVELPKASVNHGIEFCNGDGGVTVGLATTVDPTETILLLSATDSTSTLGADSFHSGTLSAGDVFLAMGDCSQVPVMDYQTVEIPGVVVDRGYVQLDAGAVSASLPAPTGTPIHLPSFRALGGNVDACSTGLRADNFSSSSTLSRGNGSSSCRDTTLGIDWQRLSNPTGTVFDSYFQESTFTMAAGVTTASISLSAFHDATRTIVFVGSQVMGGQATGETSGAGASVPYGDQLVMATPVISGLSLTGINFTRASAVGAGKWTYTLVELIP